MPKKAKKCEAGAPAWMVTFSDMVTLLLTFFVLMLSMARLDQMKFEDAAGSIRDAFGIMKGGNNSPVTKPKVVQFAPIEDDFVNRLYRRIISEIKRLQIDKDIELVKDRGAVILRVNATILFNSGQTDVKPDAYPVLRNVAKLIHRLPLHLRIEGHTDNVPSTKGGTSNWDLSVLRAVSVLKFFVKEQLLPLDRLSAVGYGDQRPVDPADTPEARAKNRRVEFVLESIGSNREELPYIIDAKDQLPF